MSVPALGNFIPRTASGTGSLISLPELKTRHREGKLGFLLLAPSQWRQGWGATWGAWLCGVVPWGIPNALVLKAEERKGGHGQLVILVPAQHVQSVRHQPCERVTQLVPVGNRFT